MKQWFLFVMAAAFTLSVVGIDNADARRFGGGSSFGKQRMHTPTYNNFSQRSSAPKKSTANGQRGSARTGMMGMLGGLALGGLLGALFFGGAFEGINLFDIIMIGGAIALLVWFLRRKAESQIAYAGAQAHQGGFAHDMQPPAGKMLRPIINEQHFLKASRDIFMRMQSAWDAKDIDDIRKFCTAEIADRIEQDMHSEVRHQTEVVTLDANIADSWIESDMEWVAVNFSAMMREKSMDTQEETVYDENHDVHETWIFQHHPDSDDPTWYLAGIQQQG